MKNLDVITLIFVVAAGVNWGLVALFHFNAITYFIAKSWVVDMIYVTMAVASLYLAIGWRTITTHWKSRR